MEFIQAFLDGSIATWAFIKIKIICVILAIVIVSVVSIFNRKVSDSKESQTEIIEDILTIFFDYIVKFLTIFFKAIF